MRSISRSARAPSESVHIIPVSISFTTGTRAAFAFRAGRASPTRRAAYRAKGSRRCVASESGDPIALPYSRRVRSRPFPPRKICMARDQVDMTPIETREDLVAWLEAGSKPRSQFRIGTEHEKFVFRVDGLHPVSYEGHRGIRTLLEGMQHLLGWEPIVEAGNIIGLFDVTGGGAISLEPGGQFELSGAPVETVHQTCSELMAHLAQVKEIARPLGIGFLGLGMAPNWRRSQIPMMPKGRYRIMTAYMPKVGKHGLDMMYRTCTVHAHLDYSSEAHIVKKLRR